MQRDGPTRPVHHFSEDVGGPSELWKGGVSVERALDDGVPLRPDGVVERNPLEAVVVMHRVAVVGLGAGRERPLRPAADQAHEAGSSRGFEETALSVVRGHRAGAHRERTFLGTDGSMGAKGRPATGDTRSLVPLNAMPVFDT